MKQQDKVERLIHLQRQLLEIGDRMARMRLSGNFSLLDLEYVSLKNEYSAIRNQVTELNRD